MRSSKRLAATAALFGLISVFSAAPAVAQKVTLDNVVVGSGPMVLRMPRIEFDTPSLPEAELRGLFDPAQSRQLADRLRRLSARVVTVYEFQIEQTIGAGPNAQKQNLRYGGMALTDVQGGKARFMRMAPSKVEAQDPVVGKMEIQLGPIAADEVDLAFLASFMTESGNPAEPKRSVYKNFVLDGMSMNIGQAGTLRIGKMVVGDVRMRPLKKPYAEIMNVLLGLPPGAPPTGEALRAMLEMYADFFDAYETTASEVAGVDFEARAGKEPVKFNIARIAIAPFANGVMEGFSLEGFKLDVTGPKAGSMNFGSFGFKAIDFKPFSAGIARMGATPPEQYLAANWRDVLPNFSGFFLKGFAMDAPDNKRPDARIKFTLGNFDLALAKHVLGIPTDIALTASDATLDLAATRDPNFAPAIAIGYNMLKASHSLRLMWDEASKSLRLSDSLQMPDVANLALEATVANVPAELFGKDLAMMQVAALGATAKDAKLTISNLGVYERVLGMLAQQQRSTPDALKQQFGGMAQMMLPQFLGGSPSVLALSQAIGKFAQNGKTITIVATSKNPGGIGLPDAMAISSPQELLEQVELQATAD